jgi:hypothetical protein
MSSFNRPPAELPASFLHLAVHNGGERNVFKRMLNRIKNLATVITVLTLLVETDLHAKRAGINDDLSVESTRGVAGGLWEAPTDIRSRNLYYGPGGAHDQPGKRFTFVKEDLDGTNPKLDVRDENGVKWKVKLGSEVRAETAASRLVWAVGYHADEDYFIETLHVTHLPRRLHRGQNLIAADGTIRKARLKRQMEGKKIGYWTWRNGPFAGTREFNGLRILMALINNWDLKDRNNAIYEQNGQRIYQVKDLGASFGTTGVLLVKNKAKGNLGAYRYSKFITKVTPERVSFAIPGLPSFPYLFAPWDYIVRARLRWIGRDISRADAKWVGELLGQLAANQIKDAFRAAGYSQSEVDGFTQVVQKRVAELNTL